MTSLTIRLRITLAMLSVLMPVAISEQNTAQETRAKEIFKRHGAQDISYTGESSVPRSEARA